MHDHMVFHMTKNPLGHSSLMIQQATPGSSIWYLTYSIPNANSKDMFSRKYGYQEVRFRMKALIERDEALSRAKKTPRAIRQTTMSSIRSFLPKRITTPFNAMGTDGCVEKVTVVEDCLRKAARYFHQKDITLIFRSDKRMNSIFSMPVIDIVDPSEFERRPDEPKAN